MVTTRMRRNVPALIVSCQILNFENAGSACAWTSVPSIKNVPVARPPRGFAYRAIERGPRVMLTITTFIACWTP